MILGEATNPQLISSPTAKSREYRRMVLRKCEGCGEEKLVQARQVGKFCSKCHMRNVGLSLANTPEEAAVAYQKSLEHNRQRSKALNAQRVMAPCIKCGVVSERPVRSAKTHPCVTCSQSESWAKRIAANKEKGLTARGIPFVELENRHRAGNLKWYRKMYKTPLGRFINLMRAHLAAVLKKGQNSGRLPYGPKELLAHVHAELEACDWKCPMCVRDLHDGYQVDHKIPLATAKSEAEIVALFSLDNLSVLCGDCNMRVKRARLIKYETNKEDDLTVNSFVN